MEHHKGWGTAFADGLKRHGWTVHVETKPRRCDMIVFWGARHAKLYREQSGASEVCLLERGYLGDRFQWASVSFGGGLNGRGRFAGPFDDGSRWGRYFAHLMRPWRETPGRYALVMHQVPGDMATVNVNLGEFYRKARAAFSPLMEVRERRHPRLTPKHGAEVIQQSAQSLAADLEGAAVVVTWNSNGGVDAVLAGVPTVAMDEGSMAWAVTGHALEIPPMPDRTAWAKAMAWKQWRVEEMASGACWEAVGSPYARAAPLGHLAPSEARCARPDASSQGFEP
jgi:hypothetical protein